MTIDALACDALVCWVPRVSDPASFRTNAAP